MKRLGRGLLALAGLVALALALGVLVPRGPGGAGQGARLLVLSGPIHTDLALPLDAATRARFAFAEAAGVPLGAPGAEWLIVGWGGRAFYLATPTWRELRPGPVLRSFGWDASVLHLDAAGPIDEGHPAVRALAVSPEGLARIEAAVLASLADPAGAMPGYGPTDRFFPARGGFNLVAGCNTWTGAVLRAGGLRTGAWTPLPRLLDLSLALHAP